MEKVNQILMQKYPFVNFEMGLPFDACEPIISKETLIHHYEYLNRYIVNINFILSQYPKYQNFTIMDIIMKHDEIEFNLRAKLLELAGGIFNHEFVFYLLTPPLKIKPKGNLLKKINKDFGGYENLKKKVIEVAFESIGSRYVGIVLDEFNNLKVVCFEKETTPYVFSLKPLYMLDLFEHAYYLDEKQDVEKYIEKSFEVIDFEKIEGMYNEYVKSENL